MENKREKLGSRLGFILISAGCAIGCGNVWKFPWLVGENGGGAFVLVYLICLVILGIPVMTVEFALGRAAQKSPVKMYQALEPKNSAWHLHGYFAMGGNYILMMFYTVVCGWMFNFFLKAVGGEFTGNTAESVQSAFGSMVSDPVAMVVFTAVVVALGFFICSFDLQKGLERVSKYMMLALLLIMAGLAIRSFFLEGAAEGLKYYLIPDFSKINFSVIVAAMNQAFFTLSVGIGSMAIFGSYIGKDRALLGESVRIVALDTFVAITAGLIIFPACFTYDVDPTAGPSLIFVALPTIFNGMDPIGGRIFGSFFFLFMSFAAFSTVLAVFENILACFRDLTGMSRKKACLVNGIAMFVLSVPCALGFNLLSGVEPLGAGTGIMDLEDFIVSNCLLPIGSMLFVLFATWKQGFGWDNFLTEANSGKGMKVKKGLRVYMAYVLPAIILALFVIGVLTFFKIVTL